MRRSPDLRSPIESDALEGRIEVPVVDLARFRGHRAASEVRDGDTSASRLSERGDVAACSQSTARAICASLERFGFVRLVGHGVSQRELDRVDALFARFFSWPEERKLRASGVAAGQRGYSAFGREHARDRVRPDPKAFYHVGQPAPRGLEADSLPANVFPDDLPELRDASLSLFAALEGASKRLLEAIEIGLRLEPGVLSAMLDGGNSILRALHYPALDAASFEAERRDEPDLVDASGTPVALRAAPHEDINLVTLLPASHEPGLEISTHDVATGRAGWLPIAARPGEIVADVGDMLARFTGGRLAATTHRVVASIETAGRVRRSYPFFAHPRPECDLAVHPAFVDADHEPPWPPITAGAFLAERLREIGLSE